MRFSTAATILFAALASSPLLAADDVSTTTIPQAVTTTQFLSPANTTGFWQVAGTGQFQLTSNVSVRVDYLHYQPNLSDQHAKEPDAYNLRGAYDFSHHWQGFVQVAGGTYIMSDPNTALALQEQETDTMNIGGGVRYNFNNGVYLEGVVQLADPSTDLQSPSIKPLMSVGYQF
ncbi:hypothetical protein IC617_14415 [Neiella sp. HB171785]|uniref:Outer membrane protein beta-barrel domain-containing protein n=1 Tax=Neiella litorisoli TaxID=2771431 RepID=A0A8J6QVK1_9GAMM|nr:hypothetical protein [Neiella litorisoli]MBD1390628.1 hypothetical protein [Neiella litorisoli]